MIRQLFLLAAIALFSLWSSAQQKVITFSQSQIDQLRAQVKKYQSRKGFAELTAVQNDGSAAATLPVPTAVTNADQCKNNLTNLKKALEQASPAAGGCRLKAIDVRGAVGDADILHLYLGEAYPASLLAVESALSVPPSSPDFIRRINNLGSILIEMGQPKAAIPYLKYAESLSPDNVSILNNLGQAYAQLRQFTDATIYLNQAIKKIPNHPTANLTLALISRSASLKAKKDAKTLSKDKADAKLADSKMYGQDALANARKSLQGGFLGHAWQIVQQLDSKARLRNIMGVRSAFLPEYFNINKPPIPDNTKSVQESPRLADERRGFYIAIDKLIRFYDSFYNALNPPRTAEQIKEENQKRMQQANRIQQNAVKLMAGGTPNQALLRSMAADAQSSIDKQHDGFYHYPFSFYAYNMNFSLDQDRGKDIVERNDISVDFIKAKRVELTTYWNEQITQEATKITDRRQLCETIDQNNTMALSQYDRWLQPWLRARYEWDRDYFQWRVFFTYIAANSYNDFRAGFYHLMRDFCIEMRTLAEQNLYIGPCYNPPKEQTPPPEIVFDTLAAAAVNCPYTDLTAIAGSGNNSITINCLRQIDIIVDESALESSCTPKDKQAPRQRTLLLGLDAGLKNYLLIEDGMFTDSSIDWSKEMKFNGSTNSWWLNSGISFMK